MIIKVLVAWFVMALCVVVHASGVVGAFRWFHRSSALVHAHFWYLTLLLIRLAGVLIVLHLIEISLWALLYAWRGAMPDLYAGLYFSAVTYTTTGYGDLVLPEAWRLVGGIEALTGILMCGWSTGFFFAVVNHMLHLHDAETTGN
jgi:voltage-gated potassium channel Kch